MKKLKLLGVMFLALVFSVVNVKALEVSTLQELKDALEVGGEIVLTSDLEDVDTLVINENVSVVLDLNGHSITTGLKSTGRHYYAIDNYGTFVLKDSQGNGVINARGIENLGGTMTINGGTIVSVDANGGAAIWNEDNTERVDSIYYFMPDSFDMDDEMDSAYYEYFNETDDDNYAIADLNDGYMYLKSGLQIKPDSDHIYLIYYKYNLLSSAKLYINNGTFRADYVGSVSDSSGPGCLNSSAYVEIHGGNFTSLNKRTYSIISTGEISIDESVGDVVVSGTHGGIGINSGKATINGGNYSSTEFYGIWITNNGNVSDVAINGGTFTGKYGLYSTVDDGKQDVGDVSIVINGGTFNGTVKAAVAMDSKNSENEWGMIITGGTFNSDITKYLNPLVYMQDEDGKVVEIEYEVELNTDEIPEDCYIETPDGEELENVLLESLADNDEIDTEYRNVSINVLFEDKDVKDLPEKMEKAVLEISEDAKVLKYFDLSFKVVDSDNHDELGGLTELNKKVKLAVALPEELPKLKEGFTRVYYIVRVHGGKVEVLDAVLSKDGTEVVFETDKFSEYALAYNDVEDEKEDTTTEEGAKEEAKEEEKKSEVTPPDTFDGIVSYMIIAVIAAGMITYISLYLKKRFNH